MPGRTPPEAFQAFIQPIEDAAACLGQCKVTTSQGGKGTVGTVHTWSLNRSTGYIAAGGWHLDAQMQYEIVAVEGSRLWRVRTRAYGYRLAVAGQDAYRAHWHPFGKSPVLVPHLHLALTSPDGRLANSLDAHLHVGRITFEDALRWAFELGMPAAREDWARVLDEVEAPHLEHRTWSDRPAGWPP